MAYALFCQKFACKKLPFIRYKTLSTNVAELNSFFFICLLIFVWRSIYRHVFCWGRTNLTFCLINVGGTKCENNHTTVLHKVCARSYILTKDKAHINGYFLVNMRVFALVLICVTHGA